ncbi:MAG: LysM peptidoglycan-binding domain-containing protein [Alphaproteobacteria bacterium]|nr:LysM peptidoglycan-binding domain-containing protein [Alphaproteobacteria bacterium]
MTWMLSALGLLLAGPAHAQDGSLTLAGTASAGPPDRYVIQPGDTLWDISTAFMGDPYYWPRLWSINDYITNPHWIYPGNVVVFRPGTLLDPPEMAFDGPDDPYQVPERSFDRVEAECGPDVDFTHDIPTTRYIAPGVLAQDDDLEIWGDVFAAKTGQISLGEGDTIYLKLDDPDLVDCGDIVSLYAKGRQVRHPDTRKVKYGRVYHVLATARVVHREGDTTVAIIRDSYGRSVQRGDLVGPAFPVEAELPVTAPRGEMDATIVSRLGSDLYFLSSVGETVFIDRGKADGLRVGNSFYVVHRRDEALGLREDRDDIPAQVVGRIVITRVDEDTATGVVVDASRAINVGDDLAMQVE